MVGLVLVAILLQYNVIQYNTIQYNTIQYNTIPFTTRVFSLRKEELLPELFPQTPVSSYSWPRSTQVADNIVSPSCFRSSLPHCPFSWCPLCYSFSPSVVVESCNVSRPIQCNELYFTSDTPTNHTLVCT